MNERHQKEHKATREYLPSLKELRGEKPQKHRKANRRVGKGRKLGKKLWREYYKSIEFISKL